MLLVIHNLPSYMRYTDVKSLILSKCGVSEVILDNLTNEGTKKKVTVGLAEESDAAIIVRKINGLFLDGSQLYVEDARRKKEQPYRPSRELVAEMSLKSIPDFHQSSNYNPAPEENAVAVNAMPMMYNNMAMTGMYFGMPMAMAAQDSFMGFSQQAPVPMSEYPTRSLEFPSENATGNRRDMDYQSFNLESNPSPQRWGNEKTSNKSWDARQPFFAQSSQSDYTTPEQSRRVDERPDYRSERNPSPQRSGRNTSPPGDRFQRRDTNDRNIRVSFQNTDRVERFEPNPNSFDIGPQRSEPDRSFRDRSNQRSRSPMERQFDKVNKRPADRNAASRWDEPQPKRMAAYQDVNYPQNDFYAKDLRETLSSSRNIQQNRTRDIKPAYQNNLNQGRNWNQPREQVKPSLPSYVPPFYQGPPSTPTPKYEGFKRELTQIQISAPKQEPSFHQQKPSYIHARFKNKQWLNPKKFADAPIEIAPKDKIFVKKISTRKMLQRNKTWRKEAASSIAKQVVKNAEVERFQTRDKIFLKLKICVRSRLDVLLGDRLDVPLKEMHVMYRSKYPEKDDPAFFLQVVEQAKKEALTVIGNQGEFYLKPAAITPAPKPPLPKVQTVPTPKVQTVPTPKVKPVPTPRVQTVLTPKPGPSVKAEPLTRDQRMRGVNEARSEAKAQKKSTKMEYENPDMFKLKPHLQKCVDEQLDKIYELFMNVVENPDNDDEKEICEMIADKGACEAKNVLRVNLSKRLLNFPTGLVVNIFGNVRKEPLVAFLERYGGCNVRLTKKKNNAKSYIATVRTFEKYDELCALSTAVVDGVQINIKPLNLAGPPTRPTRQQIEQDRADFIRNQINLKETDCTNIPKQKVEKNSELGPKSTGSNIEKVENKVKLNLLKDQVVKKEVQVENNNEINDVPTTTVVNTDATSSVVTVTTDDDRALAINIDDEATSRVQTTNIDDKAANGDTPQVTNIDNKSTNNDTAKKTNIADKPNANVKMEHNDKSEVKNSNNQESKVNNDTGLNDQENEATDLPNDKTEQNSHDFDVDDIDLDENDLEDY